MPKVPMLKELESKYKKNPDGLIFAALGEAYRKRGNYKKALQVLKRHLPYHSDYLLGNTTLAKCYFETGLFEEAHQVIMPFVEKNKENIKLQELNGDICLKLDLFELAEKSFKRVLFYKPKCEKTYEKLSSIEESNSPILRPTENVKDYDNWTEVGSPMELSNIEKKESSLDFMDYFDQKMETFSDHFLESSSEEDIFSKSNSVESALTELTIENEISSLKKESYCNIDNKHQEFSEKVNTFFVLLGSRKQQYKIAS
jgi:tetratricopeptide (TPR) repeat protein